jgi:hypothetical protein
VSTRGATIVLIAVWLVTALLWLTPGIVRPDGAGYVVYLPSAGLDHDLLFYDEWRELGMVRDGVILHKDVTRTDHLGNHWTVGSALVWYPAFALADLVRGSAPRNGLSLPYNVAVVATSAVAGLIALLAGASVAARVSMPDTARLAALGAWLGTPLLWYSLVHATTSHAVSAMACALVFAGAVALRATKATPHATAFLTGAAAGLAFAVRPQNAPVALVPLILDRRAFSPAYAAGLALGALPQLVVSTFVYGGPFGFLTGGSSHAFASFERIWTWEPLLSWYHGLLPWTPFAALGLIGIVLLFRTDRRLAAACLMLFLAEWLINATMERSFWGALAFGQRRFDNCIVVFLIGAAVLSERIGRLAAWLAIGATSLWTMSLVFAARGGLDLSRYYTPGELLERQLAALADSGQQFTWLAGVPAAMRGRVLLLMAMTFALFAIGALLVRLLSRRAQAVDVAVYLVAATLFLAWCGSHDAGRLGAYAELIARNRPLAGRADARYGLLRDELDYLVKAGRTGEAARTARELRALGPERP